MLREAARSSPTPCSAAAGTTDPQTPTDTPSWSVMEADADRVREAPGVPGRMDAATPAEIDAEIEALNAPDGPLRYAALGDAVTVPVIELDRPRRMLAVQAERCRELPGRGLHDRWL